MTGPVLQYGQTGEPAGWRRRPIVGRRARRAPAALIFALGVLVGWLAAVLG